VGSKIKENKAAALLRFPFSSEPPPPPSAPFRGERAPGLQGIIYHASWTSNFVFV